MFRPSIALFALAIASTSFASPFIKHPSHRARLAVPTAAVASFSGTWQGKCSDDDEVETLVINNSRYSMNVGGMEMQIGGLNTMGSTGKEASEETKVSLYWSKDGQKLLSNSVSYDLDLGMGDDAHAFAVFVAHGSISLKGSQLVFVEDTDNYVGGKKQDSDHSVCTYNKIG